VSGFQHQKLIQLVQGVLGMLLEFRDIETLLMQHFSFHKEQAGELHNPFQVAVSQRQLFELIMREDPEFMNASEALLELCHTLIPRLKKVLNGVPQAQKKLLQSLAPEVIAPKSTSKFNLLQDKQAWQAYQQQYQHLANDNAKVWLEQLTTLIKE
jgi:predicted component of type VI protein secretion system